MIPLRFMCLANIAVIGGEQYREGDHKDNAEHFAHGPIPLHISFDSVLILSCPIPSELYSYIRSPYRDLSVYDSVVQVIY